MENFTISALYRVQLCPRVDSTGRPVDERFKEQYMFDFDKDCNCFVFVSDYVKFSKYIDLHFGASLFIKSIVHISDDSFVYEE